MASRYLNNLLISTILVPTILCFSEESSENPSNHCPVGVRKPKQTQEMKESNENWQSKELPPVYFSPGMHSFYAVSALGDTVEIEDGSVWQIAINDRKKVLQWGSQEPITITQNSQWFSRYKYRMINQYTGSSLEANLFYGPIINGHFTHYVTGIDIARGEIVLDNTTRWKVSYLDLSSFENWMIHDPVIIGTNSGWDSYSPALLINVTLNEHVRAQEF